MTGAAGRPRREPVADKRLGQHFLLDGNLTAKIARLAGPLADRVVIEVGPGPGGLTRALLQSAAKVIVVEKDQRFVAGLQALRAEFGDRLDIVVADALAVDERALLRAAGAARRSLKIIANLPYNIATPLLLKWLVGPLGPEGMVLMFQKEVARRIVAVPGSRSPHGRLSVIAQAVTVARIIMDVPARAFTPPPKVDSAVVRFEPLGRRPADERLSALQEVTRAAFGQRRKMLRSSLRDLGGEALLAAAGVDANRRAETLSVADFLALAELHGSRTAGGPSHS